MESLKQIFGDRILRQRQEEKTDPIHQMSFKIISNLGGKF